MRRERGLRDQSFDAPEAVPDPDENSDTEDRPKGEEPTNANADTADELCARAEVHHGTDERGLGKETFPGRTDILDETGKVVTGTGAVRVRKGSTRPQQSRPSYGGLARHNRRRKLLKATWKSWSR